MNAQQIINESQSTDFLSLFYLRLAEQKLADDNLTKCIKNFN